MYANSLQISQTVISSCFGLQVGNPGLKPFQYMPLMQVYPSILILISTLTTQKCDLIVHNRVAMIR